MEVELTALNEKAGVWDGTVLVDVSQGIMEATHESATENEDEDSDCHSCIVDLSKLPEGTKRLKLRIMP
jgi:hypothetical protein